MDRPESDIFFKERNKIIAALGAVTDADLAKVLEADGMNLDKEQLIALCENFADFFDTAITMEWDEVFPAEVEEDSISDEVWIIVKKVMKNVYPQQYALMETIGKIASLKERCYDPEYPSWSDRH